MGKNNTKYAYCNRHLQLFGFRSVCNQPVETRKLTLKTLAVFDIFTASSCPVTAGTLTLRLTYTMDLKRPQFKKPGPDDFYAKLRREVEETVLADPKYRRQNIAKSLFLLAMYVFFYCSILVWGNATPMLFLGYMFTGFAMMVLFINAFHDSVHSALFKKPWQNRMFMNVLAIFGSSPWLWEKRHMHLHHPYPNVQHWDIDIKQSDIVRIFPESKWLKAHRFQHLYMWLIYPLYSLNWLYIRDFKDFFGTADNYVRRLYTIPKKEYFKLFAAKIFNLFYLIGVPMLVLDQPWYIIVCGWLIMHVSASVIGVIALISTHVDEDAVFPSAPQDGKFDITWAEHQMLVTKDFSTGSKLANFLYGGFTHHVAHHLFPNVGHTYYPAITPIIKRYAAQHNLPYTNYPFYKAVRSHFRLLREKGSRENLLKTGEL